MKRIPTSKKGKYLLVDDEDFERTNCVFAWKYKEKRGAIRNQSIGQFILNTPASSYVLHKNGNVLDNRKKNLYITRDSYKPRFDNARLGKTNTSRYKGAYYLKKHKKWIAQIEVGKKKRYLGIFSTAQAAHRAYETARKEILQS